jgi:hypothetical protein
MAIAVVIAEAIASHDGPLLAAADEDPAGGSSPIETLRMCG